MHEALTRVQNEPIPGPPSVNDSESPIETAESRLARAAARRTERRQRVQA